LLHIPVQKWVNKLGSPPNTVGSKHNSEFMESEFEERPA
jgi:hypothetical protein